MSKRNLMTIDVDEQAETMLDDIRSVFENMNVSNICVLSACMTIILETVEHIDISKGKLISFVAETYDVAMEEKDV